MGVEALEDSHFSVIKPLAFGEGEARSIFLVRHIGTNGKYVMKTIHSNSSEAQTNEILNEVEILHQCNSLNIVQFYGAYINKNEVKIIMEHMNAGDFLCRRAFS